MGLNMAITELESEKALCRPKKMTIARVFLKDLGQFASLSEVDRIVDLKKAREKLGNEKVDTIIKAARIKVEGDELYLDKIKDPANQNALQPFANEVKTHWINVAEVPADKRRTVLEMAKEADSVTEWDLVEFDDMYSICGRCGLSWDNKKGCVGNFGPSGSPIPELAKKYHLNILAKVNELAESKQVLSPKEAGKLLEEIKVLRIKMPSEGKMMVRRTEGTLGRLEAMAKCAKEYNVGFYFF